ncbi:hypothetical protein ACRDU6_08535 [Mycolicibacterium sp. ELW1]|uniref:hypothetical protein n=1 Tax=Mycobacteriaceae TaxID=1762 RepID=UPI00143D2EA9|nr:hypothetical protein [Mycobacterium sp. ELW1]
MSWGHRRRVHHDLRCRLAGWYHRNGHIPGGGVGIVAAVTTQGSSNTAIADNVVNDSTS